MMDKKFEIKFRDEFDEWLNELDEYEKKQPNEQPIQQPTSTKTNIAPIKQNTISKPTQLNNFSCIIHKETDNKNKAIDLEDFRINKKNLDSYRGFDNNVIIPEGITRINSGAFSINPTLESVVIPHGVKTIGSSAFYLCENLKSIDIPDSVKTIGASAFSSCYDLKSITIPDSVKTIGASAFSDCSSLKSITIPNSVTSIERCTFDRCSSLKSITIPGSVSVIGGYAFRECSSLSSIVISEGVKRIEYGAFSGCSSLKSIVIPDGVVKIGSSVFDNCPNLESITILDSATILNFFDFLMDSSKNLTINCHAGSSAEECAKEFGFKYTIIEDSHSSQTELKPETETTPAQNILSSDKAETVFISYSSIEQQTAEEIKQKLESNGISCWMAPQSIPAGSDYGTEIPKALKNCRIFLLVLSENSQKSKWVPKELDMAINKGLKIIPFQIDNSEINERFEFSLINCQRKIAYKRTNEAYKELINDIFTELNNT